MLPEDPSLDSDGLQEQYTLIDLYVLAEKLQDVKAKNAILRGLITSCYQGRSDRKRYTLGPQVVTTLYKGTAPGSKARQFVVELKAWDSVVIDNLLQEGWPYEFLTELAFDFLKHRDTDHNKKKKIWSCTIQKSTWRKILVSKRSNAMASRRPVVALNSSTPHCTGLAACIFQVPKIQPRFRGRSNRMSILARYHSHSMSCTYQTTN